MYVQKFLIIRKDLKPPMNSKNMKREDIIKIFGGSSGIKEGILSSFKMAYPSFYRRNEEDIKSEYYLSLLQTLNNYDKEIIIINEDHISVDIYFVMLLWSGVYNYVCNETQQELHTLPLLIEMFDGKDDNENETEDLGYVIRIKKEIFKREIQSGNIQIVESFEKKIIFNEKKHQSFMDLNDLVDSFKETSRLFGLIY